MGLLSALIQGAMKTGYVASDVVQRFDGKLVKAAADLTVRTVAQTTKVALSVTSVGLAAAGTVAAHAVVLTSKGIDGATRVVDAVLDDRTKIR